MGDERWETRTRDERQETRGKRQDERAAADFTTVKTSRKKNISCVKATAVFNIGTIQTSRKTFFE
jgi:hypothetical protein